MCLLVETTAMLIDRVSSPLNSWNGSNEWRTENEGAEFPKGPPKSHVFIPAKHRQPHKKVQLHEGG
jgi:hypothetical protein